MLVDAVVACLVCAEPELATRREDLAALVRDLMDEGSTRFPVRPSLDQLQKAQAAIDQVTGGRDRIALVAGGPTRIKTYVFEAPKLPEIRGASAMLDWVEQTAVRKLWQHIVGQALGNDTLAEACVIYAGGGGFLAFAPAGEGPGLAKAIEQCYTHHTLTAQSVAVSDTFRLLELRYGRAPLAYWYDAFAADWTVEEKQHLLKDYYYLPEQTAGDSDDDIARRFFNRKTFGELVTLLSMQQHRRRSERSYGGATRYQSFYPLLPWNEKCSTSDVRPAVWRRDNDPQDGPSGLSHASARKRYVGQIIKSDRADTTWYTRSFRDWVIADDELPGYLEPDTTIRKKSWEQQWVDHLKKSQSPYAAACRTLTEGGADVYPAWDVHAISDSAQGYIGMIYADGNNVGRLMATLKTPQVIADVSWKLSETAKQAVFAALEQHLVPQQIVTTEEDRHYGNWLPRQAHVHPFEILTIGGDDLLLIVPGNVALELALTIGREFEQRLATEELFQSLASPTRHQRDPYERYTPPQGHITAPHDTAPPIIGLSAGVVIAQETAPIFFLRNLVDDLLKHAKERAKKHARQGFYGGAIDFMVMKSITMVSDSIASFRQQALGDTGITSKRRLTARPYSWHEFAGLLTTARELKKAHMPRSQLYRLRRVLEGEPDGVSIAPSVMEYLYTRTRMQSDYADALVQHIDHTWCLQTPVTKRSGGLPPWMPLGATGWETIWADLVEVYDMLPEPDRNEQPV